MTQIGNLLFPEGSIDHIDLDYQPTQSEGGAGRCVRVWHTHRMQGQFAPSPPGYSDFRGTAAQTIRRNVAKLNVGTNLVVLLEPGDSEVDGANGGTIGRKAAAAARKA